MILLYHFCLQRYSLLLDICSKVYILIFCLSYGQSAVERGFSANKEYIKENQSEYCLVSLRIIHNHLTFKKVTASSITITADMITSVRSARLRYEQCQLKTSKNKTATEKQLKRKIVTDELKQVKQKKICLQESVCELVKDADKLSLNAEEKNDLSLLSRSNDLLKLANCKRKDIDDLDKLTENLILGRESIICEGFFYSLICYSSLDYDGTTET